MLVAPSPPCTCAWTARLRPSQRQLVVRASTPYCNSGSESQAPCTGRRELLISSAATLAAVALTLSSSSAAFADDGGSLIVETVAESSAVPQPTAEPAAVADAVLGDGFMEVDDDLLAYRFVYPVKSASGRALPIIFSRRPERYSSAAPLSVDARQRIVASLTDLRDAITVTVSVGPSSGSLLRTPQPEWTARQVAEAVLADRSTSRVTAGQRVSLNSVEDAMQEERGGQLYFVYDHITQGSPNLANPGKETYRRALSVTSTRTGLDDGVEYLYTLNLACPQDLWDDLQPVFKQVYSVSMSSRTISVHF